MQKIASTPWHWQARGYEQAVEVVHASRTLYCSGQAAVSEQGEPSDGDMSSQLHLILRNLEAVLTKAGYCWHHVVRINYFTTSIDDFFRHYDIVLNRLAQGDCKAAATLVEVRALAQPSLLVEIEITAAK